MKRFLIGGSVLLATVILLAGCGSSNQPASTASAHTAYAGGDGAFGEDPVQPGEHSRERFMNAVSASEQVSTPTAQSATSR